MTSDPKGGAERRGSVGLSPAPSTIDPMTVTLDLPAEAQARLQAEATRRGITLDQLIAELAHSFPAETDTPKRRLSFIGVGHSGRGDLSRRHREIRAERTAGLTANDF